MNKKGYCHSCRLPHKSGYCIGTPDKPHLPEAIPPCDGCRVKCDWTDEKGCRRFKRNPKVEKMKLDQCTQGVRL